MYILLLLYSLVRKIILGLVSGIPEKTKMLCNCARGIPQYILTVTNSIFLVSSFCKCHIVFLAHAEVDCNHFQTDLIQRLTFELSCVAYGQIIEIALYEPIYN